MNNFFKYGFFGLIVVVILLFLFRGRNSGDKLYMQELEDQLEQKDMKILRLSSEISRNHQNIARLNDSLTHLNNRVLDLKTQEQRILQNNEKQVETIDFVTLPELDSIIRSIYPDSLFRE